MEGGEFKKMIGKPECQLASRRIYQTGKDLATTVAAWFLSLPINLAIGDTQ
jgi:hypothetical protein